MATVKYPKIHVQLSGEDSNAFNLISIVSKAIRSSAADRPYGGDNPEFETALEAGYAAAEFTARCVNAESYDEVLLFASKTVNIS